MHIVSQVCIVVKSVVNGFMSGTYEDNIKIVLFKMNTPTKQIVFVVQKLCDKAYLMTLYFICSIMRGRGDQREREETIEEQRVSYRGSILSLVGAGCWGTLPIASLLYGLFGRKRHPVILLHSSCEHWITLFMVVVYSTTEDN